MIVYINKVGIEALKDSTPRCVVVQNKLIMGEEMIDKNVPELIACELKPLADKGTIKLDKSFLNTWLKVKSLFK